ncbi:MAG: hypothetical protein LBL47_01110 [Lactobacillus sp.]|jgi:hypothetical protein|nr:hypothetical protein [Lactobacillus sp.]
MDEKINEKKACLELAATFEKRVEKHLKNRKSPIQGISEGEKMLGKNFLDKYLEMPEEVTELLYQIFRYSDNKDNGENQYLTLTASSYLHAWLATGEINVVTLDILLGKGWWPNNIARFFLADRTISWIKKNYGNQAKICLHNEEDLKHEFIKLNAILPKEQKAFDENTKRFPHIISDDTLCQILYERRIKRIKLFRECIKTYSL